MKMYILSGSLFNYPKLFISLDDDHTICLQENGNTYMFKQKFTKEGLEKLHFMVDILLGDDKE